MCGKFADPTSNIPEFSDSSLKSSRARNSGNHWCHSCNFFPIGFIFISSQKYYPTVWIFSFSYLFAQFFFTCFQIIFGKFSNRLSVLAPNCDVALRTVGLTEELVAEACTAVKTRHECSAGPVVLSFGGAFHVGPHGLIAQPVHDMTFGMPPKKGDF